MRSEIVQRRRTFITSKIARAIVKNPVRDVEGWQHKEGRGRTEIEREVVTMHKNGTPQEVIEYMAVVREYWAPFNYESFCVELGRGEPRSQLVQLADVCTTALAAIGRPVPPDRHGIDLLPVLEHATARTRDYAVAELYANSFTITDGDWILHQALIKGNKPLYWYGHRSGHYGTALGPYVDGRREVNATPYPTPTWLSHKRSDPAEPVNLSKKRPDKLREMQRALKMKLIELKAPAEQLDRLGLREV